MAYSSFLDNLLEKLSKLPEYVVPKNEIVHRFKNYDSISKDEKYLLWDWVDEYLRTLDWPWKYAYALYFDLSGSMDMSTRRCNDLLQFYSAIMGEGILEEDCIRFKGEPQDLDELEDYLAVTDWLSSSEEY